MNHSEASSRVQGKLKEWVPYFALVAMYVLVRLIFISADPPLTLLNDYSAAALMTEPVAKASEARNYALFGGWTANAADNYQYWHVHSPAWVYPLAAFFKLFGVGYVQLRCYAILLTSIGFAAVLAFARFVFKGLSFYAVGAFLVFDVVYVLYSRSGMLEPAFNSWVCLALLCMLLARRSWGWLVVAEWAMLFAFLTKQGALYAAPAMAGYALWFLWRHPLAPRTRKLARWVVLGNAAFLAALLFAYMRTDAYLYTIRYSLNHLLVHQESGRVLATDRFSLLGLFENIFNAEKIEVLALGIPITGPLALVTAVSVVVRFLRRKPVEPWLMLVAGCFLGGAGGFWLIKDTAVHYALVMAPSAALLAAYSLRPLGALARTAAQRFRLRRTLGITVLVGFFGLNMVGFVHVWRKPRYELAADAKILTEAIGPKRAAVIGGWAGPVAFETPYEHYFVKGDWNATRERLDALTITHLLLTDGKTIRSLLEKAYPGLFEGVKPSKTLKLRSKRMNLYAFPEGLQNVTRAVGRTKKVLESPALDADDQ